MEKKVEIVASNIVLIGEFDPINFDKFFFIKNNIFKEEDFQESTLFSHNLTKIKAKGIIINIDNNQIVIVINEQDMLNDAIIAFIKLLKEKYSFNIGLNQRWFMFEKDITKLTREKFYPINSKAISEFFENEDSAFGYYASKRINEDSRFKIDIKPMSVRKIIEHEDIKVLSFNFNYQFENDNIKNFDLNVHYPSFKESIDKILNEF